MVKNPPVNAGDEGLMQETILGWEEPLERKMATDSSILAWEIPWTEKPGRLQSMGLQKSRTQLSDRTTTTNSTEKLRESEILRPRH